MINRLLRPLECFCKLQIVFLKVWMKNESVKKKNEEVSDKKLKVIIRSRHFSLSWDVTLT